MAVNTCGWSVERSTRWSAVTAQHRPLSCALPSPSLSSHFPLLVPSSLVSLFRVVAVLCCLWGWWGLAAVSAADTKDSMGSIDDPHNSAAASKGGSLPTTTKGGEGGAAQEEEDDGAIPDIDDLDGEDLMMAQPAGEEEDEAALPPQSTTTTGKGGEGGSSQAPHYLKAEEPEDNIVKTSGNGPTPRSTSVCNTTETIPGSSLIAHSSVCAFLLCWV